MFHIKILLVFLPAIYSPLSPIRHCSVGKSSPPILTSSAALFVKRWIPPILLLTIHNFEFLNFLNSWKHREEFKDYSYSCKALYQPDIVYLHDLAKRKIWTKRTNSDGRGKRPLLADEAVLGAEFSDCKLLPCHIHPPTVLRASITKHLQTHTAGFFWPHKWPPSSNKSAFFLDE